jgi:malonyl CoA-acyl carrier protein transacylase
MINNKIPLRNSLLSLRKETNNEQQDKIPHVSTKLSTEFFEQTSFKNGEEMTTTCCRDVDQVVIATTYKNEEEVEDSNEGTNQYITRPKDIDQVITNIKTQSLEETLEEGKLRIEIEELLCSVDDVQPTST